MTIRHLRAFVAVCELGSVTQAAASLHVAQPAVSYTISEIEKYYGVRLFNRINQRLSLTEFGGELLQKAKNVLASFEEFERCARGSSREEIRIGATLTIGRAMIPEVLSKTKILHPELRPYVHINKMAAIYDMVNQEKLDFAVVEGKINSHGVASEEISGDRLIAVCKADYPAPERCSISEIASLPLLLRERGTVLRDLFDARLSGGAMARPLIESTSNEALISSARHGLGVAILPSLIVSPYIAGGELREIELKDAPIERKFYLIMREGKTLSESERLIYEMCKNFNETEG